MNKIDRIIEIVRYLKEDSGMGVGAVSGGPTNKTGPSISGTSPGETPPVFRKRYAKGGKGSRVNWLTPLIRRKPPNT